MCVSLVSFHLNASVLFLPESSAWGVRED